MAITADAVRGSAQLDSQLAGLDALEIAPPGGPSQAARAWRAVWPRLGALVVVFGVWELVVLSHWRPDYVIPPPGAVLSRLWHDLLSGALPRAMGVTLTRAVEGYALAVLIGLPLGLAVSRFSVLRAAFGSVLTGLQTMPSIAWFPFAILLFKLSEGAILFVVVLGAAPSIANGVIAGVDTMPPILLRAADVLGARGFTRYRHVVLPAALPSLLAGFKQGWAFAWRSLMAGELLVIVPGVTSLGVRLQTARDFADAEGLLAAMLVILVIGIAVDTAVFGTIERSVLRRRGLSLPATRR